MIEITLLIKHETDKAYLVSDGDRDVWLPKSQVELLDQIEDEGDFEISEWLAKDKELI